MNIKFTYWEKLLYSFRNQEYYHWEDRDGDYYKMNEKFSKINAKYSASIDENDCWCCQSKNDP